MVEEDVVDWRGLGPEPTADVKEPLLLVVLGRPGQKDDGAAIAAEDVQGGVEAALNTAASVIWEWLTDRLLSFTLMVK